MLQITDISVLYHRRFSLQMKRFSNMYRRNLGHIKINVYQMVFIIIFITAEVQ